MDLHAVADLRGGGREGCVPPRGPKFFQFHAVFGKIWQNRMLAPPGELAPPPRGNPGSATDMDQLVHRPTCNFLGKNQSKEMDGHVSTFA